MAAIAVLSTVKGCPMNFLTIIMNSVAPKDYGLASALSAKMRSLGMVLSMMVITIYISIYIGKHMIDTHTAEFMTVMSSSFIIFAFFAAVGTYLSLMRSSGPSTRCRQ